MASTSPWSIAHSNRLTAPAGDAAAGDVSAGGAVLLVEREHPESASATSTSHRSRTDRRNASSLASPRPEQARVTQ